MEQRRRRAGAEKPRARVATLGRRQRSVGQFRSWPLPADLASGHGNRLWI